MPVVMVKVASMVATKVVMMMAVMLTVMLTVVMTHDRMLMFWMRITSHKRANSTVASKTPPLR